MKFGFSLETNYGIPMAQVMELVADAGFCAVSVSWNQGRDVVETVRLARKHGLLVQSLHGSIRNVADLWSHDPQISQAALQDFLDAATACAALDIPTLVVHTWYGMDYTFCRDNLRFDSFDALVTHAKKLGILIAFEHLEGPEFFAALMDRFRDHPHVGLCWDSGHEACYNLGWDFLGHYGDRLTMTHLNDNLGLTSSDGHLVTTDDLHLIPGDGIINWKQALQKLKASKKQDILNLELKIRPHGDRCALDLYSQIPLRQYFRQAYEQACRIFGDYFDA